MRLGLAVCFPILVPLICKMGMMTVLSSWAGPGIHWGRGQRMVCALQHIRGMCQPFFLLHCTPLSLLQHMTNSEHVQSDDRVFLVTCHVKLNSELFLCRIVCLEKENFSVDNWFLKCRIYFIQSLLDFFPHCWGWKDRQPSKQSVTGGTVKLSRTGSGTGWTCETTPRLAKREALGGGTSYIDSAFTSLPSPYYPRPGAKAGTCIGQWQSFYTADLKETKSILGWNEK